jgi:hypothetical protein
MVALAAPALATLYLDGPPTGHTGGFGEPTCHSCHFSEPFNAPNVSAQLKGLPDTFVADSVYTLVITVAREGLGAGGFSASSRFGSGSQAGSWTPSDKRSTVETTSDGVEYAMHALDGTEPLSGDSTSWTLYWQAPVSPDTVFFHLAANAANGDDSELGDFIGTDSTAVIPIY